MFTPVKVSQLNRKQSILLDSPNVGLINVQYTMGDLSRRMTVDIVS